MRTLHWLVPLALITAFAGCNSGSEPVTLAETMAHAKVCRLLHNGVVFTGSSQQPSAQAIVVCDEKIVAVGSDAELGYLSKQIETIDLGGRTVVPGINDAHVHVLASPGTQLNTPAFAPGPGPTLSEVLALIEDGAKNQPAGSWLVVSIGSALVEDPLSTRQTLDTVSPDHPVLLKVWSGHGTYINSRAITALGWSTTEPDPFGGHLGRIAGSNELSGVVYEYAEHQLNRKLFEGQTDEQLAQVYRGFATQAVGLGYTSITDIAIGLPLERQLRVLALADLPIRVRALCFPLTQQESCDSAVPKPVQDRVTATGFKWITDGSPVERGAFLDAPYSDMLGTQGLFNFEQTAMEAMLSKALSGSAVRNQAVIHAVGDGAVDNVLAAARQTGGAQAWNGKRLRVEHGDLIFPRHYATLKDLGAIVVQNPIHLALPDMLHARIGAERSEHAQPLKSLLAQGIPLAFGTDVIGRVESPWLDIFFATVHPTTPSEAITISQAVTAYTQGSAYAENEEHRKGTIEVGMLADLAVLSQDVFSAAPPALPATQSLLTMVGGKIVWRASGL
jgi:predicted amidohydrolase YtcJ